MARKVSEGFEISKHDSEYPDSVLELGDAPDTLFARGDLDILQAPSLSVIGSRRPTPYGLAAAELAGSVAAQSGLVEVSGGARGVDQAGGWAALREGGAHVIVLGTGADVDYPKSVSALIERTLSEGGTVVSPAPWGSPPRRFAFPRRNRIIAALSSALFISEAALPSGTFSTAECAVDLGREVLVAPGSMFSPESRGSNYLIANGATLISDEDALEIAISRIYGTLRLDSEGPLCSIKLEGDKRRLLDALLAQSLSPAEIQRLLGKDLIATSLLLSEMEIDGFVTRLIDGRYSVSKKILHDSGSIGHNGSSQR